MIKDIHETGELFKEVQMQNILGDGKTFPDCTAKRSLEEIVADFKKEKKSSGFDLKKFIAGNFSLPKKYSSHYKSDSRKSARQHVHDLWDVLTRKPDEAGGSLIPLPYPYIVPGGRFGEIYYWDSYFTMLGLEASGRIDMIRSMINNFAFLIDTIGYIPNGNRTYFIGRSQPPFFSLMVKLLNQHEPGALVEFTAHLEKEYAFWMRGADELTETQNAIHRVARLPDGSILNRYWDENDSPRPESYKEDVELAEHSDQQPEQLFRHLRAAAESGWDFSSRWFRDSNSFASIHTTEIIPIDLNCLLLHLEQTLFIAYQESGDGTKASHFLSLSAKRKSALLDYCWNEEKKFFFDFDFVAQKQKEHYTLAATFPLYFEIATRSQAKAVAIKLEEKFLQAGGLSTSLINSGQQWDAPNGWAPLQWIAYKGLMNYGLTELASKIKIKWTGINEKVYQKSGKMTEKYDVWSKEGDASGGEYPNQDGFGWTNGVYLAMKG